MLWLPGGNKAWYFDQCLFHVLSVITALSAMATLSPGPSVRKLSEPATQTIRGQDGRSRV